MFHLQQTINTTMYIENKSVAFCTNIDLVFHLLLVSQLKFGPFRIENSAHKDHSKVYV